MRIPAREPPGVIERSDSPHGPWRVIHDARLLSSRARLLSSRPLDYTDLVFQVCDLDPEIAIDIARGRLCAYRFSGGQLPRPMTVQGAIGSVDVPVDGPPSVHLLVYRLWFGPVPEAQFCPRCGAPYVAAHALCLDAAAAA